MTRQSAIPAGTMPSATPADYRWLIDEQGRRWLDRIASDDGTLVRLAANLRRELRPEQVHVLLEQQELRRRAQSKFATAGRMFFTRRALEQATDDAIARYKAARFARQEPVADLCCGIGGDLLALGSRGPAIGVDKDPVMTLLAAANASALGLDGVSVATEDAITFPIGDYAAWHIDPDRRAAGARTSQAELSQPAWPQVIDMFRANEHAAIKLAPAARLPTEFAAGVERQWIGSRRECRQQVVWTGGLARHPGRRTAVVVDRDGAPSTLLVEADPRPHVPCGPLQTYVYDPHAAVLAAGLGPELANRFALQRLDPEVAYLTGDHCVLDPHLATFQVLAAMPLDLRRVRAALKQRDLNPSEIKKRNVAVDPATLRQQLRRCGKRPATLILTKYLGQRYAIIATRLECSQ